MSRYSFVLIAVTLVDNRLPWATFGVNVVGSFCIGIAAVLIGDRVIEREFWRLLLVVGFSWFLYDIFRILPRDASVTATGQLQYRYGVRSRQCNTLSWRGFRRYAVSEGFRVAERLFLSL